MDIMRTEWMCCGLMILTRWLRQGGEVMKRKARALAEHQSLCVPLARNDLDLPEACDVPCVVRVERLLRGSASTERR